jgi:hypothetical protein
MGRFVCVGIVGVFMILTSFGQQPFKTDSLPVDSLPEVPAETSADYKNDPLYQEIQRQMLRGSAFGKGGISSSVNPVRTKRIDEITDVRWQAVESILFAARMLEKERQGFVDRNELDEASRLQAVVKSLRLQALELL